MTLASTATPGGSAPSHRPPCGRARTGPTGETTQPESNRRSRAGRGRRGRRDPATVDRRSWRRGTSFSRAYRASPKRHSRRCSRALLGCQYQRVQFTPDLLPSDVTGTSIFDRNAGDFVLRKGPIFTQLLLADEINRAPAKTQSALLEAMQEHQVTVDGTSLPLELPFLVLAAQEPGRTGGRVPPPRSALDRFLLHRDRGTLGFKHEVNLLGLHSKPVADVNPMFKPAVILDLQRKLPGV